MPKTKKRGQSEDYETDAKHGKVRKGRLTEGGSVVFDEDEDDDLEDDEDESEDDEESDEDDDEDEESDEDESDDEDDEDDEDEEPEPVKPAKKAKAEPPKKVEPAKKAKPKKAEDDEPRKVKPSMVAPLPASQRKIADEKLTKKSVVVTIKDLEEESGLEGKKLRRIIRGMGYKAPDVDAAPDEFGAKKKYLWDSKSPVLKAIRAKIAEELGD